MNSLTTIQDKILDMRGQKVILDRDLAAMYGVETRVLNQAVKRNIDRFPNDFMFQLDVQEFEDWRSQNVISNSDRMGLRKRPYAFTELGPGWAYPPTPHSLTRRVGLQTISPLRGFANVTP